LVSAEDDMLTKADVTALGSMQQFVHQTWETIKESMKANPNSINGQYIIMLNHKEVPHSCI
jgi:hypothetical protein